MKWGEKTPMRSKIGVVSMLLVLWGSAPVTAQTYDQLRKWCYGDATNDQTIQGCDAIIKSGRETPLMQAAAFSSRGVAYENKGQYDLAIQDYSQAIKLNPYHANAFANRCGARAIVGQLQAALADCNESLRLRPNDASTLDSRGFTYLKLGQFDAAIADYDSALRIDPKKPYSLFGRGVARRKKGDLAGGGADIAAAKAIKSDIAEVFAKFGLKDF